MSKVNVIIPVYNVENSIERCVESLVFGKYGDIEIILIDDCSEDDSFTKCKELAQKYSNVKCFQNESNAGVSATRNLGLEKADSEYIIFVDSDDWVSCEYVYELINTAEKDKDSLVICGLHFIEEVAGYRRDYIWQENGNEEYIIYNNDFFDLRERFHLQQLWNKIFRRDIIEKYNIRFDETQSMGEDFQFVLDYLEASKIKKCTVLNKPLYYYVRANTTSLMSKFGLMLDGNDIKRQYKLLNIVGADCTENQQRCEKAIQNIKNNAVYQAVRSEKFSKKEKIEFINQVMNDTNAKLYYNQQKKMMRREGLLKSYKQFISLFKRLKARKLRKIAYKKVASMKSNLKNKDFTIISQNCIGGVFYHDMGLRFNSPTINLFFSCPDFVKFVLNLDYYLSLDLKMTWLEEYPVGYLDDVAIHFMHYKSCTQAKEKWEERKKRIIPEKIIVISTDRNDFTDEVFEEWKKIKYPKVLYTVNSGFKDEEDSVFFDEYAVEERVPDLIPSREFYKNGTLMKAVNSFVKNGE